MKTITCELCGTIFTCKDIKRNAKRRFCSGQCAKRYNGQSNKGNRHTEEWKQKLRECNSGKGNPFYGKRHSEETKNILSKKNTGKKHTPESKEKIRQYLLASNPFKGKKQSVASKARMGRNVKGKNNPMFGRGELLKGTKNGSWKGGISTEEYTPLFNEELRTQIRKRDNFTCICRKNGFCVHHIDYNKKNNIPSNLITLCRSCHGKTNFNRKAWEQYFLWHYVV